jgi:hypothetical protein
MQRNGIYHVMSLLHVRFVFFISLAESLTFTYSFPVPGRKMWDFSNIPLVPSHSGSRLSHEIKVQMPTNTPLFTDDLDMSLPI